MGTLTFGGGAGLGVGLGVGVGAGGSVLVGVVVRAGSVQPLAPSTPFHF